MREELGAELEERDYAKAPLSRAELEELFAGRDPRGFLNPKSPAFKARALKDKTLTAEQAIALMAEDPNLIKRPLVAVGKRLFAGFDRDALRKALG